MKLSKWTHLAWFLLSIWPISSFLGGFQVESYDNDFNEAAPKDTKMRIEVILWNHARFFFICGFLTSKTRLFLNITSIINLAQFRNRIWLLGNHSLRLRLKVTLTPCPYQEHTVQSINFSERLVQIYLSSLEKVDSKILLQFSKTWVGNFRLTGNFFRR